MSKFDQQEKLIEYVRVAIDKAFPKDSEEYKEVVFDAFLKIQDVERYNKSNQVVKITDILSQLQVELEEFGKENEHG